MSAIESRFRNSQIIEACLLVHEIMENSLRYIDIHAHVNFAAFEADRQRVVERALAAGVWMINVGTQRDTSARALKLAESFSEGVYASIGLHPTHTTNSFHDAKELGEGGAEFYSRGEQFDAPYYESLAKSGRVVAIGECGLDYYRLAEDTKAIQRKNFILQIELANKLNLPLMLHVRQAYDDAYEILKTDAKVRGNLHFFAGTLAEAKLFLDLGFTLSFTGVITFARSYDALIRNLPLSSIMTETDCPYVAPVPYRGRRNEPLYVREVVKAIADIRRESIEKVAPAIFQNALGFFNIAAPLLKAAAL